MTVVQEFRQVRARLLSAVMAWFLPGGYERQGSEKRKRSMVPTTEASGRPDVLQTRRAQRSAVQGPASITSRGDRTQAEAKVQRAGRAAEMRRRSEVEETMSSAPRRAGRTDGDQAAKWHELGALVRPEVKRRRVDLRVRAESVSLGADP